MPFRDVNCKVWLPTEHAVLDVPWFYLLSFSRNSLVGNSEASGADVNKMAGIEVIGVRR